LGGRSQTQGKRKKTQFQQGRRNLAAETGTTGSTTNCNPKPKRSKFLNGGAGGRKGTVTPTREKNKIAGELFPKDHIEDRGEDKGEKGECGGAVKRKRTDKNIGGAGVGNKKSKKRAPLQGPDHGIGRPAKKPKRQQPYIRGERIKKGGTEHGNRFPLRIKGERRG